MSLSVPSLQLERKFCSLGVSHYHILKTHWIAEGLRHFPWMFYVVTLRWKAAEILQNKNEKQGFLISLFYFHVGEKSFYNPLCFECSWILPPLTCPALSLYVCWGKGRENKVILVPVCPDNTKCKSISD